MIILSIETSCDETSLAFLTDNFWLQEKKLSLEKNKKTKNLENLDSKISNLKESSNLENISLAANSKKIKNNLSKNYKRNNFVDYLNSFEILDQVISSQIDIHKDFGGVIPEIGAREHASQIHPLFQKVLESCHQRYYQKLLLNIDYFDQTKNFKFLETLNYNITSKNPRNNFNLVEFQESNFLLQNLDYIFVTTTPGLASALRVGLEFAKTLQFFIDKKYQNNVKLRPVNHLQGHLASCFWQKVKT